MDTDLKEAFRTELITDEAKRSKVYDDATGNPIARGSVVKGNPTIAIGRNLATRGLLPSEIEMLFENDFAQCQSDLNPLLPWLQSLTVPRQVVIYSLYFNMYLGDPQGFLSHWPHFLAQMQAGEYAQAADNLETSEPWATQVGRRATRLADMVRG